jgi:hypothetical protein
MEGREGKRNMNKIIRDFIIYTQDDKVSVEGKE